MARLHRREGQREGKEVVNHGRVFTLQVEIGSAAEIDGFANHSDIGKEHRQYRVHLWVDPETMDWTRVVKTWTNPTWKECFEIPVDFGSLSYDGTLSLEVERITPEWAGPTPDPGTSSGNAIVGRVKVRVPKLGQEKGGRFGLIREKGGESKAEGFVFLNMKLVRRQRRSYYY